MRGNPLLLIFHFNSLFCQGCLSKKVVIQSLFPIIFLNPSTPSSQNPLWCSSSFTSMPISLVIISRSFSSGKNLLSQLLIFLLQDGSEYLADHSAKINFFSRDSDRSIGWYSDVCSIELLFWLYRVFWDLMRGFLLIQSLHPALRFLLPIMQTDN